MKRLSGTSGACDTFGNLCLAHNEDFELKNVEVSHIISYQSEEIGNWLTYGV